jgi:hypothetical protein
MHYTMQGYHRVGCEQDSSVGKVKGPWVERSRNDGLDFWQAEDISPFQKRPDWA